MAVFESNAPSLANRYASSLGQGLEQLAQHKLQQMQQEKQRQQIEGGLAGIFGSGANQLSQLYSQPKLLQALVSSGIERGTQTPEGQQKSLAELYGQPYISSATTQQKETQEAIQRRHDERLKFEREREEEKLRHQKESIGLGRERLDIEREKIGAGKEKLETTEARREKETAINTNKPFVDRMSTIRETTPGSIRNLEKVLGVYTKNPNALLTGPTRVLADNLGVSWLAKNAAQDIVEQGLNQEQIEAAQLWKGLGSYSDREGMATQKAMANLYNTPEGAKAILRSSIFRKKAQLALANAEEKIRSKKGYLPLGGDLEARKNAEPELNKLAEEEKNAFRKIGVVYPYDIPKQYLTEISGLPEGQEFTVSETGTRWRKTANGPIALN